MKQNDLMKGRNEGLRLALTIAERDGIDGLRKELEYRGITKLDLNVSHKELQKATEQMRVTMFDTMRIFTVGLLMDLYGFGKKRVLKWVDDFNLGLENLGDDPAQWQEMVKKVNDYIGCDLSVYWNEKDSHIHVGE